MHSLLFVIWLPRRAHGTLPSTPNRQYVHRLTKKKLKYSRHACIPVSQSSSASIVLWAYCLTVTKLNQNPASYAKLNIQKSIPTHNTSVRILSVLLRKVTLPRKQSVPAQFRDISMRPPVWREIKRKIRNYIPNIYISVFLQWHTSVRAWSRYKRVFFIGFVYFCLVFSTQAAAFAHPDRI